MKTPIFVSFFNFVYSLEIVSNWLKKLYVILFLLCNNSNTSVDYCCVVMRGFEVKLKMIRLDLIKKKRSSFTGSILSEFYSMDCVQCRRHSQRRYRSPS